MVRIAFDKERVLAGHFLLQHLTKDQLKHLAAQTTITNHPARSVIFQKGSPGDSMMAVIRGRVKICTHSLDGKELVLNIIARNGLFGEIALLDGEPRTADAVALEETDLLVLHRSRFTPFLTANPEVMLQLFSVLCKRLRQTSETLEEALLLEAPSRLARALLRLALSFGKPAGDTTVIDMKLSQGQLASLVGLSRESVNKLLGEWTDEGILAFTGGIVTVRDRPALEAVAQSEE